MWKENRLGLIRGTYPAFAQRYTGNLKEISVRIDDFRAKRRTKGHADKKNRSVPAHYFVSHDIQMCNSGVSLNHGDPNTQQPLGCESLTPVNAVK
jgi:hypothetical protein